MNTNSPSEPTPSGDATEDGQSLPPIHTMADDLRDAQSGRTPEESLAAAPAVPPRTPVPPATPVTPPKPAAPFPAGKPSPFLPKPATAAPPPPAASVARPRPARAPTPLRPAPAPARPLSPVPARPSRPTAGAARPAKQPGISLPAAGPRKRSRAPWVLLGVLVVVFIGAATWGVLMRSRRTAGTIADHVPVEALAFLSVRRGAGALEQVVIPRMTTALGATPALLGDAWEEAAYVLLPGGAPSAPVPMLLLRGTNVQPRVEEAADVAVRPLRSGAVAVVPAADAGRLEGLSGAVLGRDRAFRALKRGLPPSAPGVVYLRADQVDTVLRPFTLFAPVAPGALLFALGAEGAVTTETVGLTGARSTPQEVPSTVGAWERLARGVPAAALSVVARPALSADVDAWRVAQTNAPALQRFLQALAESGTSLETLRGQLAGPYVAGALPTTATGVRDGFALVPLAEGADAEILNTLRPLEEAFRHLDAFLAGSAFPNTQFEEADYNGVRIRYVNFGDPSRSFDYAVTDSLLLVATSRESMRLVIDVLKGTARTALPDDPVFQAVASVTTAGTWQVLRVDPAVLPELPLAWQHLLGGIAALGLAPSGDTALTGALVLRDEVEASAGDTPPGGEGGDQTATPEAIGEDATGAAGGVTEAAGGTAEQPTSGPPVGEAPPPEVLPTPP